MKKILLSLLAVGLLAFTGYSQTNSLPAPSLSLGVSLDAAILELTTATNWTVAPFFTYHRDIEKRKNDFGGGLAAIFNLTDKTATVLRVESLSRDFYLATGNLQLQLPFDAFNGKVRVTPFGFLGGGQKFGSGDNAFIGIAGTGMDFKIPSFSKQWSAAFDAEYWSDRPGVQWRFAPFVWKF